MISTAPPATLEDVIDVIAEDLISPSFREMLADVHSKARRKVALRIPEHVYTDEIETPDGYPCCEIMALSQDGDPLNEGRFDTSEMSLIWTVNGDHEQNMGRELKRLIQATKQAIALPMQPMAGSIYTGRIDFGPFVSARALQGQSARFIKSASVAVFWQSIG